ncbi:MAG: hypothetical protein ACTHM6_09110 [Tepidisphaeraceae bacterium]
MQWIAFARRWLGHCVIEHAGEDRPFRLRRVSLLLLSAGWCAFLGSCLLSVWIIRHNLPLVSFAELLHGSRAAVFDALPEAQRQLLQGIFWMTQGLQWAGAALFFGGLGSVAFFDKRDGVPAYSAD